MKSFDLPKKLLEQKFKSDPPSVQLPGINSAGVKRFFVELVITILHYNYTQRFNSTFFRCETKKKKKNSYLQPYVTKLTEKSCFKKITFLIAISQIFVSLSFFPIALQIVSDFLVVYLASRLGEQSQPQAYRHYLLCLV